MDKGWDCFFSMGDNYGINLGPEHHACFMDLLLLDRERMTPEDDSPNKMMLAMLKGGRVQKT